MTFTTPSGLTPMPLLVSQSVRRSLVFTLPMTNEFIGCRRATEPSAHGWKILSGRKSCARPSSPSTKWRRRKSNHVSFHDARCAVAANKRAGDNGEMNERHFNWLVPWLLVVILSASATLYVVGYFTLGDRALATATSTAAGQFTAGSAPTRIYPSKWLAKLFAPAAKIESVISGEEISAGWRGWE